MRACAPSSSIIFWSNEGFYFHLNIKLDLRRKLRCRHQYKCSVISVSKYCKMCWIFAQVLPCICNDIGIDHCRTYCILSWFTFAVITSPMSHHVSKEPPHLQWVTTSPMSYHISNESPHLQWVTTAHILPHYRVASSTNCWCWFMRGFTHSTCIFWGSYILSFYMSSHQRWCPHTYHDK